MTQGLCASCGLVPHALSGKCPRCGVELLSQAGESPEMELLRAARWWVPNGSALAARIDTLCQQAHRHDQ